MPIKTMSEEEYKAALKSFQESHWELNYHVRNLCVGDEEDTRLYDDFWEAEKCFQPVWVNTLPIDEEKRQQFLDVMCEVLSHAALEGNRYPGYDLEEKVETFVKAEFHPFVANKQIFDNDFNLWEDLLFAATDEPIPSFEQFCKDHERMEFLE